MPDKKPKDQPDGPQIDEKPLPTDAESEDGEGDANNDGVPDGPGKTP